MKECVIINRMENALWVPDKLEGGEGKSPPGSAEMGRERERERAHVKAGASQVLICNKYAVHVSSGNRSPVVLTSRPTPSWFFSGRKPGQSRDFHSAVKILAQAAWWSHESTFMLKCKWLRVSFLFLWWGDADEQKDTNEQKGEETSLSNKSQSRGKVVVTKTKHPCYIRPALPVPTLGGGVGTNRCHV